MDKETTNSCPPKTILGFLSGCEKLHAIVIPEEIKSWIEKEKNINQNSIIESLTV